MSSFSLSSLSNSNGNDPLFYLIKRNTSNVESLLKDTLSKELARLKKTGSNEIRIMPSESSQPPLAYSLTSRRESVQIFAWIEDDNLEISGKKADEFLKKLMSPDPEMKERRKQFWREINSD